MSVQKRTGPPLIEDAVRKGLSSIPKFLPSWLFYDSRGDELFREIMQLPEYYLTACERQILESYSHAIAHDFVQTSAEWDIIELGPGDGTKTLLLLSAFAESGADLRYYPIDISQNTLNVLRDNVRQRLPGLPVHPYNGEYLQGLADLEVSRGRPRLILFMGANIGNFEVNSAAILLRAVSGLLRSEDRLLVSFDLMKSPSVIEKAYHDYKGVTTLFNKNVLTRINRELGGNFNPDQFEHWPVYDAVTGACRSYLVSLRHQEVMLSGFRNPVAFLPWETIHMEISQKYSEPMIRELCSLSGLQLQKLIFDDRRYFSIALIRAVN